MVMFFMVIYHGTILQKKSPSNIPRKSMGPEGLDPLNFNSEKALKNDGCLEDEKAFPTWVSVGTFQWKIRSKLPDGTFLFKKMVPFSATC